MSDRFPVPPRRSPARTSRAALPASPRGTGGPHPASRFALRLLRFFLGLFFGVFRSSGAWKEAVAIATSDRRLREAIGDPVTPGAWVGGRLQVSGGSGQAAFVVPLHGPHGEASLRVQASKDRGVWRFDILQAQVRGGASIDLLRNPPAPGPGTPSPPARRLP
jgi:hypothetical protein